MATASQTNFFNRLSKRSRTIIMAAVFALFAPLPLVVSSPVGTGHDLFEIVAWFVLGGLIAVSWAYCFFAQRFMWLPPIVTVALSMAFPLIDTWSTGAPVENLLPVSIAAVVLVVFGYVGFVAFISIEGTKSVRMQAEMDVARRIHSYLVPDISFDNERYAVRGVSMASTEMGGDVTDVTTVGDRICVTIADVSGHGVPAGVLMSALKGSLLTSLDSNATESLDRFLVRVNKTFHAVSTPDMYCTMTSIILKPDGGAIIYNAGHCATLLYRASQKRVELIESSGIPVGILADIMCESTTLDLQSGDIFALVTDGLTETEDSGGAMLGMEPLAELLAACADDPAEGIVSRFFERAEQFGSSDDDRTVMVVRVK